jgi:hypothetical protein
VNHSLHLFTKLVSGAALVLLPSFTPAQAPTQNSEIQDLRARMQGGQASQTLPPDVAYEYKEKTYIFKTIYGGSILITDKEGNLLYCVYPNSVYPAPANPEATAARDAYREWKSSPTATANTPPVPVTAKGAVSATLDPIDPKVKFHRTVRFHNDPVFRNDVVDFFAKDSDGIIVTRADAVTEGKLRYDGGSPRNSVGGKGVFGMDKVVKAAVSGGRQSSLFSMGWNVEEGRFVFNTSANGGYKYTPGTIDGFGGATGLAAEVVTATDVIRKTEPSFEYPGEDKLREYAGLTQQENSSVAPK